MSKVRGRAAEIGERIRTSRSGDGRSVADIAEAAGIPEQTLYGMERGLYQLANRVSALAFHLSVDPEEWLGFPITREQLNDERLEGVYVCDIVATLEVCGD